MQFLLGFFFHIKCIQKKVVGSNFSYLFFKLVTTFIGDKVGTMHGMEIMLVELKIVDDYLCVLCSSEWIFLCQCLSNFCWNLLQVIYCVRLLSTFIKGEEVLYGKKTRKKKKGQKVHRKHIKHKKDLERAQQVRWAHGLFSQCDCQHKALIDFDD